MFLYPFVNLIKWLFGSFSSDLVLCVFDNISCNIITVINIMLIVLIVNDLYNILLRYIIINRKMIVLSRQESGGMCFHLSLVWRFWEYMYMWTDVENGVKNGDSLDLNPKVRISPKYEIGYRNLIGSWWKMVGSTSCNITDLKLW